MRTILVLKRQWKTGMNDKKMDREHVVQTNEQISQPSTAVSSSQFVSSTDLMQGKSEIVIAHRGQFYHLQETRNGKLILTK